MVPILRVTNASDPEQMVCDVATDLRAIRMRLTQYKHVSNVFSVLELAHFQLATIAMEMTREHLPDHVLEPVRKAVDLIDAAMEAVHDAGGAVSEHLLPISDAEDAVRRFVAFVADKPAGVGIDRNN